jgi:hypothetical protein
MPIKAPAKDVTLILAKGERVLSIETVPLEKLREFKQEQRNKGIQVFEWPDDVEYRLPPGTGKP